MVFEGHSIKATMQRTTLDARNSLGRRRGGSTHVHATGAEAITGVMKEVNRAPDLLILK
jgi:hypothetical protein